MQIRATIKLRNEKMLAARTAKGWNQQEAAIMCGVPASLYASLERLVFPKTYRYEEALLIADALGLDRVEDVLPERMVGWDGETKFSYTQEIPVEQLLRFRETQQKHYVLPSPEEEAEKSEQLAHVRAMLEMAHLTEREKMIVKIRFGLGGPEDPHFMTYAELAKMSGLSGSRVREIEKRAIRKLERLAGSNTFMAEVTNVVNAEVGVAHDPH
jgi:RNA polymerase sigma factor (sigma-70 family)